MRKASFVPHAVRARAGAEHPETAFVHVLRSDFGERCAPARACAPLGSERLGTGLARSCRATGRTRSCCGGLMADDHVATTVVASFLAGLDASAGGTMRDLADLAPALDPWRSLLRSERRAPARRAAGEPIVASPTPFVSR